MCKPLKVTFDKNVYEFIVDPDKPAKDVSSDRATYREIQKAVKNGRIQPFISETILTYDALGRDERKEVLTRDIPIVSTSDGNTVTLSSNPYIFSENRPEDIYYLSQAIALGFKILPDRRFGKLKNPAINPDYYYLTGEEFFAIGDRFEAVTIEIERMGAGYEQYRRLIGKDKNPHLNVFELLKRYDGGKRKLKEAIAERSDGDSVALHIAYKLDYFCTNDNAGRAGENSVLSMRISDFLSKKFGFQKISSDTLADMLARSNYTAKT